MTWGPRSRPQAPAGEPASIGDRVVIVAGRHRGATGELVGVEPVPTPAGGRVFVAIVRRPRAGDTVVFNHEVRKVL